MSNPNVGDALAAQDLSVAETAGLRASGLAANQIVRARRPPFDPDNPPEFPVFPQPVFLPPPLPISQAPRLVSIQPGQVTPGLQNVVVTGVNLPTILPYNYSVLDGSGAPSPFFQILSAVGTSDMVTLGLAISPLTPGGTYVLQAQNNGLTGSIQFVIVSGVTGIAVQPSTIQAGAQSVLTVTGSNLPPYPQGYSIVGATPIAAGISILSFPPPNPNSVSLLVNIPQGTPGGNYQLLVLGLRGAPLQILSAAPAVPRVDSVQPFEIVVGVRTTLSIRGVNLPSSSYFIAGFGPIQADFFPRSLADDRTNAVVDVTVKLDQFIPNAAYSLFAVGGGQGAPVLLIRGAF